MKDTVDQIYDELNAQVVRMLEHSLNQASRIAELESRIEFNGDHSQDGIVKRDERIADLERQLAEASAPVEFPADGRNDDPAEAAFWRFDARKKGYSRWKGAPQSERDAFKAEYRAALAAPQAADTDKVREALKDLYNAVDSCVDLTPEVMRKARSALESTMAAQAPVREVPEPIRKFLVEVSQQHPEKPDYWSECGQCGTRRDQADELLEQFPAAIAREVPGYRLVPIEATEDMQVAFLECWFSKRRGIDDDIGDAYAELLAAAPLPAAPVQQEGDL